MHKNWIFILSGVLFKFFTFCQEPPPAPDYSKTPVLFVHGAGLSSKTWNKMIKYFISIGYPSEFLQAIDLIPSYGSNKSAAINFIKPAAEDLLQRANIAIQGENYPGEPPEKIDIVSHSMGAVSSRFYATNINPAKVRKWISIAGANHGTNALCSLSNKGEGSREMCPAFASNTKESDIQVLLNGTPTEPADETPYGLGLDENKVKRIPPDEMRNILYFTIRIEPDQWIKPEHSAILDGSGGVSISIPHESPITETSPGNFLFQKKVGHDPLPKNSELIRFVALLLSARNE